MVRHAYDNCGRFNGACATARRSHADTIRSKLGVHSLPMSSAAIFAVFNLDHSIKAGQCRAARDIRKFG